jgi:catechol 2,3-dioxygenase-like lactoylglutathione lyase family enzyme
MSQVFAGLIPFYGTNNLVETDRFYGHLLGLQLYKDQGACRIYEVLPGAWIGFCTHMEVAIGEHSPIITLLTEDVDGMHRHLVEQGYQPDSEPKENPKFKIYHFFAKDPNGYLVEIQKFLD